MTKVINIILAAQENSPLYIAQALDKVSFGGSSPRDMEDKIITIATTVLGNECLTPSAGAGNLAIGRRDQPVLPRGGAGEEEADERGDHRFAGGASGGECARSVGLNEGTERQRVRPSANGSEKRFSKAQSTWLNPHHQ